MELVLVMVWIENIPQRLKFWRVGWIENIPQRQVLKGGPQIQFRCGFGKRLDHKGSELIGGLIHWWVNNWMDYCGGSGGTETVGGSLVGGSRSLAACLGNVCLLPGPFFAFCFMAIRGWAAVFLWFLPWYSVSSEVHRDEAIQPWTETSETMSQKFFTSSDFLRYSGLRYSG